MATEVEIKIYLPAVCPAQDMLRLVLTAHSAFCHLTDGAQHPTCLNPSRQLPNLRHTSSGSNQPETISRAPSKEKDWRNHACALPYAYHQSDA